MNENELLLPEDADPKLKKLTIQGDAYFTNYTRKYTNRKAWTPPSNKEVKSFIPGTIREVSVKEGDIVAVDQKLLVLEAMKMMNTVYSPLAGKIKSLKIQVGDCIPKGTLMIEFE